LEKKKCLLRVEEKERRMKRKDTYARCNTTRKLREEEERRRKKNG
jgi:hypothetical protein